MRDSATIMQHAKSEGVTFPTAETAKCLDTGLALLYLNENVMTYFVDNSGIEDVKYINLLTDKNRLIQCIEEREDYNGLNIFKQYSYLHYACDFDLNGLLPEKTSFNVYKQKGLFGAKYGEITLTFVEGNEEVLGRIRMKESDCETAYGVILAHAEEYGEGADEEPAAKAAAPAGGKEAEMKQIREMHEAGLISKEEMMELMKSLLGK